MDRTGPIEEIAAVEHVVRYRGIAGVEELAFMLYSVILAESLLADQGAQAQREDRQQALERMLLQPVSSTNRKA